MKAADWMSSGLRPLCHCYYVQIQRCRLSFVAIWRTYRLSARPFICGDIVFFMVTGLHFRLDGRWYRNIIQLTYMRQEKANTPTQTLDAKAGVLGQHGALHPNPEQVKDEVFRRNEFFDSRDLVQVRYEMLRRRQVDGQPVTDVAAAFGVSRQAFYVTKVAFTKKGIVGLLPRPRGPQRAHKCTDEILDFVEQWRADSPTGKNLSEAVRKRFGVAVHSRSLARALARRKKNQH
jgi:transposase